jgi:hypothetical protein
MQRHLSPNSSVEKLEISSLKTDTDVCLRSLEEIYTELADTVSVNAVLRPDHTQNERSDFLGEQMRTHCRFNGFRIKMGRPLYISFAVLTVSRMI